MATGVVKGVKARLDLKKIEQENIVEVIATVTTKDGPLKDVRLVFFLNSKPLVDETKETNPFGEIAITFDKPGDPGNYEVRVSAVDGDLKEGVSFTIKKPREQTEKEKEKVCLRDQLEIAKLKKELEETQKRPQEKALTPEQQEVLAFEHQVKIAKLRRDLEETTRRPQEPEILPDNFDAHEVGAPGSPKFIVSVFAAGKDGKRKGCRGRIKIAELETGREFIFFSDDQGDVTYPSPSDPPLTQTEDRTYHVRVSGVEREETFKKEAPPRYGPAHMGRVAFCWLILFGWFVFHYSVVGVGESHAEKEMRAYQEYQQMNESDRFFFEERMRLLGKQLPAKPPIITTRPKEFFPFENGAWWLWFGWCGLYTFASMWKAMSRAWTRVQRIATERRAGTPEYLGRQNPQNQSGKETDRDSSTKTNSAWKRTLKDVWQEIVADLTSHEIRQRILGRR